MHLAGLTPRRQTADGLSSPTAPSPHAKASVGPLGGAGRLRGPPRRRGAEGHWEAVPVGCSSLVPTFRRGPPDESLLIEGDLGSSPPHGLWPEVLLGEAAGPLAHLRWVGLCMEAVEGQGGTDRAQSEAWGPDPPGQQHSSDRNTKCISELVTLAEAPVRGRERNCRKGCR